MKLITLENAILGIAVTITYLVVIILAAYLICLLVSSLR
jgi:hypothetical protein